MNRPDSDPMGAPKGMPNRVPDHRSRANAGALRALADGAPVECELPRGLLPPTARAAPDAEVDDLTLVRRALDRAPDGFADLVARYHRKAFWIAFHVLGRTEDARDVVQESFVRLHRSLHRFDFGRNFYTWFYRIVMNLAIDALRKRNSARAVVVDGLDEWVEGGDSPAAPSEREEQRAMVWRVLDQLDEKFKTVLVLRDIHDVSCREIAPILGVTHATVRWRLHRGRVAFREVWERLHRVEGRFSGPPVFDLGDEEGEPR